MKVTVYLTQEGACALKAHQIGRLGKSGPENFRSLACCKADLQNTPVEKFMVAESILPGWSGDLKERAAVGLGLRKKSARFIERIEIPQQAV